MMVNQRQTEHVVLRLKKKNNTLMIVMVMMTMMLMMILIGIQTRQPDDDFDNIKSQKESMTVFPKVTAALLVA